MFMVLWDIQYLMLLFNVMLCDGGSMEDLIILSVNGSDFGWLICSVWSVVGKILNSMLLGVNCKEV